MDLSGKTLEELQAHDARIDDALTNVVKGDDEYFNAIRACMLADQREIRHRIEELRQEDEMRQDFVNWLGPFLDR
jgi:hypothetical protein